MKPYQMVTVRSPRRALFLAALLAGIFPWATAWSDPPALPADVQTKVNKAIDHGVDYLRRGLWPIDKNHVVGYAALPGLTLLECGASPQDPAVQHYADFVRRSARGVEKTYEIALSILFLDKLGGPKDRETIQVLALRLVAGQTPTGGWTYKCPILYKAEHEQLLTVLKKLDVPVLFDPLTMPGVYASPGTSTPVQPELNGQRKGPGTSLPEAAYQSSRGGSAEAGSRSGQISPTASRNWAWCIKMEDAADGSVKPAKAKRKVVIIPRNLEGMPVLNRPEVLPVVDPKDKGEVPAFGTSDNSNTQFAILGLWAARRHQVPTARTLNLVAKRFYTSQNADGSWGYHYVFGGGDPERPPMTCVGLLGLAVYHGLARDIDPKTLKGQDPRIVNGLLALTKNVGVPAGRTENLPMANLYFLWSVERVGVLYGLATIGNKDWYRWGAEILVANQLPNGNWDKGGYYGANPTCDTCLALLFLKRANLASDLTVALPFKPADLTDEVAKRLPADQPANHEPAPAAEPKALVKAQPVATETEEEDTTTATAPSVPVARPKTPASDPLEESSKAWIWLLGILVLVIGGGVLLALLARNSERDEEEARPIRRAKRKIRLE